VRLFICVMESRFNFFCNLAGTKLAGALLEFPEQSAADFNAKHASFG